MGPTEVVKVEGTVGRAFIAAITNIRVCRPRSLFQTPMTPRVTESEAGTVGL